MSAVRADGRIVTEIEKRVAVRIVESQQNIASLHRAAAPRKRQENHRVLQPLALVQGHDSDQFGVAFETQLGGVVNVGVALRTEPSQQQVRAGRCP